MKEWLLDNAVVVIFMAFLALGLLAATVHFGDLIGDAICKEEC